MSNGRKIKAVDGERDYVKNGENYRSVEDGEVHIERYSLASDNPRFKR